MFRLQLEEITRVGNKMETLLQLILLVWILLHLCQARPAELDILPGDKWVWGSGGPKNPVVEAEPERNPVTENVDSETISPISNSNPKFGSHVEHTSSSSWTLDDGRNVWGTVTKEKKPSFGDSEENQSFFEEFNEDPEEEPTIFEVILGHIFGKTPQTTTTQSPR